MTQHTWLTGLLLMLAVGSLTQPAGAATEEERRRADALIAQGLERLGDMPDADGTEQKKKCVAEATARFARAIALDRACDERFYTRLREQETQPSKPLQAMIRSLWAKAYAVHRLWDKSLRHIDAAIALDTAHTPVYRRLKEHIEALRDMED